MNDFINVFGKILASKLNCVENEFHKIKKNYKIHSIYEIFAAFTPIEFSISYLCINIYPDLIVVKAF